MIPHKNEFRFIPEQLEINRIASESSLADFEAIATAKVITELNEFLDVTGDNELIDFESDSFRDVIVFPAGEVMHALVDLEHDYAIKADRNRPRCAQTQCFNTYHHVFSFLIKHPFSIIPENQVNQTLHTKSCINSQSALFSTQSKIKSAARVCGNHAI